MFGLLELGLRIRGPVAGLGEAINDIGGDVGGILALAWGNN